MKDFKTILNEYKKIDLTTRRAALATVVRVRGSSYRSPGARMLITDDGRWVGSISGGCLEGDALRKARQVMTSGKPITVVYDTNEGSNQNLGISLGCNGIIDVLIEPIHQNEEQNPVKEFQELTGIQQPVAIATVFNGPADIGKKIHLTESGIKGNLTDATLVNLITPDLHETLTTKQSLARTYNTASGEYEVFLEMIQPGITLIIFGGGFDARPVSQLAHSLGWDVQVTDECAAHIAPIFFPGVEKLSMCQRQFIDRDFNITGFTACVLMSHNYDYDRDVLRKLVNTQTPYIGIMGPRKRFDKMLADFANEGLTLSNEQLERIHSPIGLDIGAEAPDEIAISIIAEIQGIFSNRPGGFLKHRSGPIHHRDIASDQVFKQAYLNPDIRVSSN